MKYQVLLLLLSLALVSCAGNRHSKIISFTPASVVVDYSDTGDLIEATDQAQRYCSSVGKDAQYVQNKEDSSWMPFTKSKNTAFFNCVTKQNGAAGNGNGGQQGGHTIINNPPTVINNSK